MTFRNCLAPFQDRYSRGPYFYEKWGRYRIDLLSPLGRGHCKAVTYARYLMSVVNGSEPVSPNEVDHIDGDRTHDKATNLRIITRLENTRKGAKDPLVQSKRIAYRIQCPHCKTDFIRSARKLSPERKICFCSKACSRFYKRYHNFTQTWELVPTVTFVPKMLIEPWESWSSERNQQDHKAAKPLTRVCKICSNEFKPNNFGQVCCSRACADIFNGNNRKKVSDKEVTKMYRLIEQKESNWRDAAVQLGVSESTVRERAKKLGLVCSTPRASARKVWSNSKERLCPVCEKKFLRKEEDQVFCGRSCSASSRYIERNAERMPTVREYAQKAANNELSWCAAGRALGMSDNAVRKWARKLGFLSRKQYPRRDSNSQSIDS